MVNTSPLKPVLGDRLSSQPVVNDVKIDQTCYLSSLNNLFFNFDIYGKHLNESCLEHSLELICPRSTAFLAHSGRYAQTCRGKLLTQSYPDLVTVNSNPNIKVGQDIYDCLYKQHL